jgi:hypothetical protein
MPSCPRLPRTLARPRSPCMPRTLARPLVARNPFTSLSFAPSQRHFVTTCRPAWSVRQTSHHATASSTTSGYQVCLSSPHCRIASHHFAPASWSLIPIALTPGHEVDDGKEKPKDAEGKRHGGPGNAIMNEYYKLQQIYPEQWDEVYASLKLPLPITFRTPLHHSLSQHALALLRKVTAGSPVINLILTALFDLPFCPIFIKIDPYITPIYPPC